MGVTRPDSPDAPASARAETAAARAERILVARARKLAQRSVDGVERHRYCQVAIVEVGAQRVGIPAPRIRELVAMPTLYPLRRLPGWFLGLVQVRGELMTALDLAILLDAQPEGEPLTLVILEAPRGPVGLAVGRVIGFEELYEDEMTTDFATEGEQRPLVDGITRDLLTVLDVDALFVDPRTSAGQ